MSEWLWLDDVRARARALGASGHALGEILHRAVVNGRIQRITGLFAKAPIERIREHWPADAALLQWVATWTIPGDLAELLLTRASGPFGIEPGNRLRAMIMWGDGAPPYEADTCVFANVRLCWPEVAGELAAAGFVLPPEWDPIASPREQPQIALAAHEANAATAPPEPDPPKPAPSISPERPARRRGPDPKKRLATEAIMKQHIEAGTLTLDGLAGMKEIAMASEYGVSRDTARKARKCVLLEFQAKELRRTSTNDK